MTEALKMTSVNVRFSKAAILAQLQRLAPCVLLVVSLLLIAKGGYIQGKAAVAQWLMHEAWQQAMQTKKPVAPWHWADTEVIGVLHFKSQRQFILSGESGRNLAFGPSLLSQSAPLDEKGNSVISGHNDTHFAKLAKIETGDIIKLETINQLKSYRVSEVLVVRQDQTGVLAQTQVDALTLITCYPFNSTTLQSKYRLVVRALLIEA
ncbi:class GN sortase [Glaciecola sp. XM2]|uniref:class GN sortase n=1 Tax=Glaciecola sp. XM2 TaxID=1914931 RepID=UPI001BDE4B37|nr:class GN sortase [Glaciecola sp. XM2]MBT1451060.1 class GN sortase [Glaciecola sp. XM2]